MYYLILFFNNLVNKIQLDTYMLNDFINIYDISIYIYTIITLYIHLEFVLIILSYHIL